MSINQYFSHLCQINIKILDNFPRKYDVVQSEARYLEPVLGLVVGVVGGVGELGHVLLEVVHEGAEGDGQHTGDGQQQVATHILHGLLYELSPRK